MIWQTVCTSSEETERLGELFGRQLNGGEVIELAADLGGGKTTFVKGLARGLGVKQAVTSPTFTLNREYNGDRGLKLMHFDFYRLSEPGIVASQLAEATAPDTVVAVEWSGVVKDWLPAADTVTIELKPSVTLPDERLVVVKYPKSLSSIIETIRIEAES